MAAAAAASQHDFLGTRAAGRPGASALCGGFRRPARPVGSRAGPVQADATSPDACGSEGSRREVARRHMLHEVLRVERLAGGVPQQVLEAQP